MDVISPQPQEEEKTPLPDDDAFLVVQRCMFVTLEELEEVEEEEKERG